MILRLSYWESKLCTAVEINSVLTPINSAPSQLRRFVEPAFLSNDDCPDFELSRRGTLTKLKYKGRYLALVTAHQMKDFDDWQLVILDEKKKRLHSANEVVHSQDSLGLEYDYDLRLYDFTQAVAQGLVGSENWFRVNQPLASYQKYDTHILLAFGLPETEQVMDYDEKSVLTTSAYIAGQTATSSITGREALEPIETIEFATDGFSGGPVFKIFVDRSLAQVCLAGVVTNASKDKVHYLPFKRLNNYLKKLFEE